MTWSKRHLDRLAALRGDTRGGVLVEFAIIAPVLCMLLLGAFDAAHTLYTRAVLQGIVQKTARDSALEAGTAAAQQTLLDNRVRAQATALANNATITFKRRFYRDYTKATAKVAETWIDTDKNGTCNNGEAYEDANLNNGWDEDGGDGGQGGAKDATIYTVTVSYPRLFPVTTLIGGSSTTTVTASTVLRNQPYADQGAYGTMKKRNC